MSLAGILTVRRNDGAAQYHVLEFHSYRDLHHAETGNLLERQILSLELGTSLSEALTPPELLEAAIDKALAGRASRQMAYLRAFDARAGRRRRKRGRGDARRKGRGEAKSEGA